MIISLVLNPYNRLAGIRAIFLGLIIHIVLTSISFYSGTHINSNLFFKLASDTPFWYFLAEMSLHASLNILGLIVTGYLLSRTQFRLIDIIGTALFSRAPLVLLPAARLIPAFKSFYVTSPVIYILILIFIVSVIWSITLLYNAFKISCNPKSKFTNIGFIAAMLLSEGISQFIIYQILP
ncbi:MAG: hypothetical protein KI790_11950 [Cyclobacteriaceae bacterium]|nr:hypothetical protein [Cyclobacteriaceae bacterium HetDA_MAG_MS6]